MPELMRDNLNTRYDGDGEIHPAEAVEEQISLSERFGLWLSFYPFRQDDYLDIVAHWLQRFGLQQHEVPKRAPRHCSSPCSADHGPAAWRCSLRVIGPAASVSPATPRHDDSRRALRSMLRPVC